MRQFLRVTTLLLLSLLPAAAFADFEIGAYGSGSAVAEMFEGIKAISYSSGYRKLVFTVLLISLIAAIVKWSLVLSAQTTMKFIMFAVGVLMLETTLFNRTSALDIVVVDHVNGFTQPIDEVPLIIAFPAVMTSEAGKMLTQIIDYYYVGTTNSELHNLGVSKTNSFNLGSTIMRDMSEMRIQDPFVKSTFNMYMRDCVMPEIYTGQMNLNNIITATDIWPTLQTSNQARMTLFFARANAGSTGSLLDNPLSAPGASGGGGAYSDQDMQAGALVSCQDSWTAQKERFDNLAPGLLARLGGGLVKDSDVLDRAVSSAVVWTTGASPGDSGTEHFLRAGLINLFKDSTTEVAGVAGSDSLIQSMAIAEARATQRANWLVTSEIFGDMLDYLFATLQVFFFGIAPIAIILFLVPQIGPKAMFNYFGILVWMALWQPFLAVINAMSLYWLKDEVNVTALNLQTIGSISEASSNLVAITGFLGTLVPMITYGLVKGGEFSISSAVSDIATPAASGKAAGSIATKSISYGSSSIDNVGTRKQDTTAAVSMGYGAVSSMQGLGAGLTKYDGGGSAATINDAKKQAQFSGEDRIAQEKARAQATAVAQALSDSATLADVASNMSSADYTNSQGNKLGKTESAGFNQRMQDAFTFSTQQGSKFAAGLARDFESNYAVTGSLTGKLSGIVAGAMAAGNYFSAAGAGNGLSDYTKADGSLSATGKKFRDDFKKANNVGFADYLKQSTGGRLDFEGNDDMAIAWAQEQQQGYEQAAKAWKKETGEDLDMQTYHKMQAIALADAVQGGDMEAARGTWGKMADWVSDNKGTIGMAIGGAVLTGGMGLVATGAGVAARAVAVGVASRMASATVATGTAIRTGTAAAGTAASAASVSVAKFVSKFDKKNFKDDAARQKFTDTLTGSRAGKAAGAYLGGKTAKGLWDSVSLATALEFNVREKGGVDASQQSGTDMGASIGNSSGTTYGREYSDMIAYNTEQAESFAAKFQEQAGVSFNRSRGTSTTSSYSISDTISERVTQSAGFSGSEALGALASGMLIDGHRQNYANWKGASDIGLDQGVIDEAQGDVSNPLTMGEAERRYNSGEGRIQKPGEVSIDVGEARKQTRGALGAANREAVDFAQQRQYFSDYHDDLNQVAGKGRNAVSYDFVMNRLGIDGEGRAGLGKAGAQINDFLSNQSQNIGPEDGFNLGRYGGNNLNLKASFVLGDPANSDNSRAVFQGNFNGMNTTVTANDQNEVVFMDVNNDAVMGQAVDDIISGAANQVDIVGDTDVRQAYDQAFDNYRAAQAESGNTNVTREDFQSSDAYREARAQMVDQFRNAQVAEMQRILQ